MATCSGVEEFKTPFLNDFGPKSLYQDKKNFWPGRPSWRRSLFMRTKNFRICVLLTRLKCNYNFDDECIKYYHITSKNKNLFFFHPEFCDKRPSPTLNSFWKQGSFYGYRGQGNRFVVVVSEYKLYHWTRKVILSMLRKWKNHLCYV